MKERERETLPVGKLHKNLYKIRIYLKVLTFVINNAT